MKKLILSLIVLIAAQMAIVSKPAMASDKPLFDFADEKRWIIRARLIDIHPDEDSTLTGLNAEADVENKFVPELDFTYFFTDHIAAELILATAKHEVSTNTGIDLGDVWVLPPTLTLQYHFNPEGTFRPYVGAGLGYLIYYGEDSGAVNSTDYDNGMIYALQVGADYGLDEHWALNVDIKKMYHQTDVSVNGGAINADVDLDPWVFGVGMAYRF